MSNLQNNFRIVDGVLVEYCGQDNIINIPEGVIQIDRKVFFENYAITEINFPSSIEIIGENAFEKCYNLRKINFPSDCKLRAIFAYAFFQTGIEVFTMPSNLSLLGLGAFQACDKLTQITFNNVLDKIGTMSFAFCESLEKIYFPNNIMKISMAAFYGCKLKEIKLPANIVEIGTLAFARCSLKEVHLPKSIRNIGFGAFYNRGYVIDRWQGDTLIYKEAREEAWSPYIIFDCTEAERKALNLGYSWFISGCTSTESLEWEKKGLCKYCGGTYFGLFSKTCSKCGMKKI
ncbi:MAG: leucine-rich repeat domain-containing protein [Clostridia bacterium]|nr:leucine-rich repeat domain-containing protein [Clostridia bacterium]